MAEAHRIQVEDDWTRSRYDVYVDGTLAGFAVYRLAAERVIFVHTEVFEEWEGTGVGSALAKAALDDVRRQGRHMTPQCPFIAGYLRRHPEYVDLVDEAHRKDFQAT